MHRRVVVTGMGVVSPVGTGLKEAWKTVIAGKSGIIKLEGPEYEDFPCRVAGFAKVNGSKLQLSSYFSKSELKTMAPATGYALIAVKEALEDAKLEKMSSEMKENTGVAVGMGMVDLEDICKTYDSLKTGYHHVSPFFVPRILLNMAAGQISIKYGFRGPNHSVSTACATGAHSIGDSFRFVRSGDADIMVCGGTEASISPISIAGFCRLRALSTSFNNEPEKASRPFDKLRDGFVMGEGSAILILEELDHALKRNAHIYAEVLGYGLSGDASHLTAPRPDGIAVSSTKGAHGHLLGAAGNLEAVFSILAVKEGIIPPTVNLESAEDSSINFVPRTSQEWKKCDRRIALKNAFGFGGTNASLCFAQFLQ
ncbi:hypothetical protein JTB14_006667 [Gonioctena quinquepunctata]|nr:hypothetical protein JTB14_006667 [Gonioctena quinquepunctata]